MIGRAAVATSCVLAGSVIFAAELISMRDPCDLISINTDTGVVSVIGRIGLGAEDFSLSPSGTMFAAADGGCRVHGSAHILITVDTNAGTGNAVGDIGFADVDAIAFAPDGTLYGVDARTDNLIRIDSNTGAGTVVGPVGFPFVGGMAFSSDGVLYGADIIGLSTLITVDTQSGQGTAIGPIGFATVEGIAFAEDGTLYGISDRLAGGTGD